MDYKHEGYIKFSERAKLILLSISFVIVGSLAFQSCKQKAETSDKGVSIIPMDSVYIAPFFKSYPELDKYKNDLDEIYEYYDFNYIWFNENGLVDYGKSLYDRVKDIEEDGIFSTFPYQKDIDEIFNEDLKDPQEHPDAELLMTSLYLFYVDEVYKGIDPKTTTNLGWLLPRKELDDTALLDSIISDEDWESKDSLMFRQYYKLREVLKRYRTISENGGWQKIEPDPDQKTFKPNDTSSVIRQIRERLYMSGELEKNNQSQVYDDELLAGIKTFQTHHGYTVDSIISAKHIDALNMPVDEYIKKIVVNMERCRWVPPGVSTAEEFIFVNIPAYEVKLYREGKIEFESPVVVGNVMTKTVIFDGMMTYIAFSPYWNIPQSIINNEVIPGMERDKNYLQKRNMEWNNGQVRQKPGRNNSLGLVKFMFPNSKSIYLHDSPAKSLFEQEDRARSHGCIRVGKARDLAIKLLEDDKDWTVKKIDAAMNAGRESTYTLKKEIPVYIGYFTAWVDEDDQINFYKDVYKRDDRLADLLLFRE